MLKHENWINGQPVDPLNGQWLDKYDPHSGQRVSQFADSQAADVDEAVLAAKQAQPGWAARSAIERGDLLHCVGDKLASATGQLAMCLHREAGKSIADAKGEIAGAVKQCRFFAGEGMRLSGRTLTSAMANRMSQVVRVPLGVAGLIVPANTPIANLAWKTFPALICGNTVVIKAAEDAPHIAKLFAELVTSAGIPAGVVNVIQGSGDPAGKRLVKHPDVAILSFTGSTAVGRWIAEQAGKRLARVSLELGGKNPFVVCADANLERAVDWAFKSAFGNAGQRCSSASRFYIEASIYKRFRDALLERTRQALMGIEDGADIGPLINADQQQKVLSAIRQAEQAGGVCLCGGNAPIDSGLASGYYVQPTLFEGLAVDCDLDQVEIFGPVATLHAVEHLDEAIALCNASEYGLTATIHTSDLAKAMKFVNAVKTGVANVNIGTFGSEPHMPFGGFGASGNGTREPGLEALDVYSELKNISIVT